MSRHITLSLGRPVAKKLSCVVMQVFAAMEHAKASQTILDWGVANATLEEVHPPPLSAAVFLQDSIATRTCRTGSMTVTTIR